MGALDPAVEGIVFSLHAQEQWKKRFRKLKRPGTMEKELEQARLLGRSYENDYYCTPCGAVLVVTNKVVKTVLLGRYIPDALRDAMRRR